MKLSGLLFLVVGLVVAGFSWYLSGKGQKMTLFIFVGVVMVVYGAWKLFIDKATDGEPKQREDPRIRHRAELEKQLPQGQRHHHDIPRICSTCKARNNPRANFCGNCGNRL